jgi:ribonuclease R
MSGLVPLSLVEDDFFVFDEARRNLVGRRTRRVIQLGDKLTVQVAKVDTFKKQVDFRLVAAERKASGQRPPAARPQAFQTHKKPSPFRPETKRQAAQPGKSRREDSRPQTAKPIFRTSGSQLPTSQRPLLKASGSRGFPKRRR